MRIKYSGALLELKKAMDESRDETVREVNGIISAFIPDRRYILGRKTVYIGGEISFLDEKNKPKKYVEKVYMGLGVDGKHKVRHCFEPVGKMGKILYNSVVFDTATNEVVIASSKKGFEKRKFNLENGRLLKSEKAKIIEKI